VHGQEAQICPADALGVASWGTMALTATLYDFDVALEHVDRDVHSRVAVKVARHPSETSTRLWLRVLAYLWLYEERLRFGPGLSDPDAPDLLADDLTGQVSLWVRIGRPDPVKLEREADRNPRARVAAVFEGADRLEAFLEAARAAGVKRLARAELVAIDSTLLQRLAAEEERRMKLSLTIVGDHLYLQRGPASFDGPLTRASLAHG
jgi:uncharacterized protein YaeQ